MQKQLAAAEEAIREDMRRQMLHQRLALIERLELQTVPPPAKDASLFALEGAADPADPADVINGMKLLAEIPAKQQRAHHAGWRQEEAGVEGKAGRGTGAEPASSGDGQAQAAQDAQTDPW